MSALHEQPVIPIADPEHFGAVRSAIETAFSPATVQDFLKSIQNAGLRIRDFELVLRKGLLGASTTNDYSRLGDSDQGQIRELYLARLEKVAPELRAKFFKSYAYY